MAARNVACPSCGAELDVSTFAPGAHFRCGACRLELVAPPAAAPQPLRSRKGSVRGRHGRSSNLMPWAIVTTLLCCQIGGIVAIVYAAKASTHAASGDTMRAREAENVARTWIWISVFTPFVIVGVALLISVTTGHSFR